LDINIFKEFSSWKKIFQKNNREHEDSILSNLKNSLTFANDIHSINFYATPCIVQLALVHMLPLRPEINDGQKKEAGLPASNDIKKIRQEIKKIFDYGLQEGHNNPSELTKNKETIQKILRLLHEVKVANFPKNQDNDIDVFQSYSKAIGIAVHVWDKNYKLQLHRTTNYHFKIEYVGDGKSPGKNNDVQSVEEL
jgi:hypothetical protein